MVKQIKPDGSSVSVNRRGATNTRVNAILSPWIGFPTEGPSARGEFCGCRGVARLDALARRAPAGLPIMQRVSLVHRVCRRYGPLAQSVNTMASGRIGSSTTRYQQPGGDPRELDLLRSDHARMLLLATQPYIPRPGAVFLNAVKSDLESNQLIGAMSRNCRFSIVKDRGAILRIVPISPLRILIAPQFPVTPSCAATIGWWKQEHPVSSDATRSSPARQEPWQRR
jgi:hypothetical protein